LLDNVNKVNDNEKIKVLTLRDFYGESKQDL
jgi:hypothetical protein